jgi:acetyl esterase/lipase
MKPERASRWTVAAGWALASLALGGCSSAGLLNAVEPKFGLTITNDLVYGEGPRRMLDVYRPRSAKGAAPVVVFFYGGNWQSGAKADYVFAGAALASKGYVVVIPDYRLYPEVRWPAFLEDSAQAVAWAKANAARYGGDPGRLVLMGHSAGAYNAAMLTVDRRWLGAVGLDPQRDVRAFVGLAGPYDFLPLRQEALKVIFGPEEGRPDTQPITHVDGAAPPMWLVTDKGDKVVDPGNTSRFAARVRERGGQAQTRFYGQLSHAALVGALATPLRFLAPVLEETRAFIDAQTAGPSRPAKPPPWP